ncbi:MAG TPA: bifunctional riboflavin kinase/FAD synthetase [Parvularculaceae bacterium]|nr:bifunctional riboflavin kinase/FAD synthetase [Parvularculaceae bacterium]
MVSGEPIIAAIGNFDGVHRGHRALLNETAAFARSAGAAPGAVVFDPHPRRFFRPNDPPFLITQSEDRNRLLGEAGAVAVLPLRFDARLAALTPEEFTRGVLKEDLGLAGVVVGGDFRFGAARAGDAQTLAALCGEFGLACRIVSPLAEKGHSDKIGSTAIREAILSGAVDRAADMLGRLWSVKGSVMEGNKVGRTLGFPTANLTLGELIEPRRGVYAVKAIVDGASRAAVANFGRRPTVGAPAPLLETHIFDFNGDLYGKTVEVAFVRFLRDEMKFSGLDALRNQIAEDCAAARAILSDSELKPH